MQKSKMVIMDDDLISLTAISSFYDDAFDIIQVSDIDQLFHAIKETKPELLLLDVEIGSTLSTSYYNHIRTLSPHSPIVFMSSNTKHKDTIKKTIKNNDTSTTFSLKESLYSEYDPRAPT